MRIRRNEGYSLIELMIVVVIIGILAALAIPKFLDTTKKSKEAEAGQLLKAAYTLTHGYIVTEDACPANLAATGFDALNGKYYDIAMGACAVGPVAFTVTATGNAAAVAAGLISPFQIDQDGIITP